MFRAGAIGQFRETLAATRLSRSWTSGCGTRACHPGRSDSPDNRDSACGYRGCGAGSGPGELPGSAICGHQHQRLSVSGAGLYGFGGFADHQCKFRLVSEQRFESGSAMRLRRQRDGRGHLRHPSPGGAPQSVLWRPVSNIVEQFGNRILRIDRGRQMKSLRYLSILVVLVGVTSATNAIAYHVKTVVVINSTSYAIYELYASPSDNSTWDTSNNLVAGQPIAPGQQAAVTIPSGEYSRDPGYRCQSALMAVLYG